MGYYCFKFMKLKLLLTLALFWGTATLHATNQQSTTVAGLKATVTWGFIGGSVLDGNCYLTNISDRQINVVTGPALGPRMSTGLISYGLSIEEAELNPAKPLKPTPGQLDIVELKPGETVRLKHFRRETGVSTDSKMIFSYHIDKEVRKFYPDTWCGDLRMTIPILEKPSSGN